MILEFISEDDVQFDVDDEDDEDEDENILEVYSRPAVPLLGVEFQYQNGESDDEL
jgi:hypothetical protein